LSDAPSPIIIGISGASGAVYGIRLLAVLRQLAIPTHLVVSQAAAQTIKEETDLAVEDVRRLATEVHSNRDIGAEVSSGSMRTRGMIIAPCSIRTLSNIAYGNTDSLISRAADVTLKERRRLVLLVRETPLHVGHLRTMGLAAEAGAIIMPPVPAFYQRPKTVGDIVDHTIGRVLDLYGIEAGLVKRWRSEEPPTPAQEC
jgi:4-hydroxy-3-polyprenylbenzoate decarboxylase